MDLSGTTYALTDREGRLYAERLIASTTNEFREEMGEASSDDVSTFVVRELTGPYQAAAAAECSSLPYRTAIDGVTVVFGENALKAFADTIWQFVSGIADIIDEPTLGAFRGDC